MYIETIYEKIVDDDEYYSDRHKYQIWFIDTTEIDVVKVDVRSGLTVIQDVLASILVSEMDEVP